MKTTGNNLLGKCLLVFICLVGLSQSTRIVVSSKKSTGLLRGASTPTNVASYLPGYSDCFKWCYWYFRGGNFYACLQSNGQCYKCGPLGGRYAPDLCGASYSNLFCCTKDTPDCCGATCADLQGDPQNCGACGHRCAPGQYCSNGMCASPATCKTGFTLCGSKCVDKQSDVLNCGSCNNACPILPQQGISICKNGVCGFSTTGCSSGLKKCGSSCVNLSSDVNNCGACGNQCSGHSLCNRGRCQCQPLYDECNFDAQYDCETSLNTVSNCGSCGFQCGPNQSCVNGNCECDANYEDVDQDPSNGCEVNLLTDTNNCGVIGFRCEGSCAGGVCQCPLPTMNCNNDGSCSDVRTDRNHCGGCQTVCPNGQTCRGGACVNICSSWSPDYCPLSEHVCVDKLTDPNNCGSCGTICGTAQTCSAGVCV